jgi:hypothetical protein
MDELSADATLVVDRSHVSAEVGGEIVVLHLTSGTYFGVDDVAAFIWGRLQEPVTVRDLRSAVVAKYDVEPAVVMGDLDRFLGELLDAGLVVVQT